MNEGTRSGFAASGEPPGPFVEASKEPEIVGVVSVPEASGPIELVLEEPLVCLVDVGKDATMTGIVEASQLETLVSNLVASSFHPNLGGYQSK
ncbi:hypothetical protein Nepgr_020565 [Nepenthes gracilis]|uniref:Uncharacterized protein n=1 Tax=Nepenthes gracilis TaxID=150966 RepID=A0AAD3SXV3_NEPGR|nr:hypothetical protein Nepgr_020565 [Nepenthes gracilis]